MADKAPPTEARRVAQARQDAHALIADSHDLPYLEAVAKLDTWRREDPVRLVFLAWQLAVWHDPDKHLSDLDATATVLKRPEAAA